MDPFFQFKLLQKFRSLEHTVFSRRINPANTALIQKKLKTAAPIFSFKNQLHGTHIWMIDKKPDKNTGLVEREGDALITNQKNIALLVRIADCAGIMLFDPKNKVIANIHAGWRGLTKKIIHRAIERMARRFGSLPKNLLAGISPMIGPCCSRFSDPFAELPKFMHRFINEENHVDLWAAAEGALTECGLAAKNIENPRLCTFCHPEDFYSYRREGKNTGRFATVIMLK